MTRHVFACAAILATLMAGGAIAQEAETPPPVPADRVPPASAGPTSADQGDALSYIQGLLADDNYDPRDRKRALNGVDPVNPFWRPSIFDGRRTRATQGTGLHLPDFLEDEAK